MNERRFTRIDRMLSGIDSMLRGMAGTPASPNRPNPGARIPTPTLTEKERRHAAGLMRVNHAGEVAAQGLYHGHGAVARNPAIARQMLCAAAEERDHLAWCEQRLQELDARPSRLRPAWYAGAWLIGAASGMLGDRWSLGFVEETERQVSEHLGGHLDDLPAGDARSRAIVTEMRADEERHGAAAKSAGAGELPDPVRQLMRLSAKIMTRTSYRW
jgi:ubiquinone biosynthesis monooxygenase Coq7